MLAFVAYKFAPGMGTFRDGGVATGWKDAATVQAGIPNYPDRTIAATIAYCDYVYRCYDRFDRPEALTHAHRQHPDH